ncbi:MAG: TRAP transporter large permease subunit [Candidatus Binatia bacterium]|nr:TRAP transporter large permease subunit [candidate division NC10 bacterium]
MEWPSLLLIFFASLITLLMTGFPIAFVFMLLTMGGALTLWGGGPGMELVVINIQTAVSSFTLLAIVEFTLMGMVIFHSGMGTTLLRVLGEWLGAVPGRLAILGIAFATLFATMSGSSLASSTVMATVLCPEMERQGYKKPMSIGPILGGGGLAMMIPPSGLAIVLAAIAKISVTKILIGAAIPGLMLAALYMIYIITRSAIQKDIAPAYAVERPPFSRKIYDTVVYVLPLGLIVFLTLGLIFLGVATPSQSAVTGALGSFLLAGFYRKLDWSLVKISLRGTVRIAVMILMIFASSATFSQILAFAGITRGLSGFVAGLPVPPIMVIVGMMIVVLILGAIMEVVTIFMVTIPIFMPVVEALGFDPIWFGLLMLLNAEMALTTPPFGTSLFAVKAAAPAGTTMRDVYLAALPFLGCDLVVLIILIVFPGVALWLPNLL